MRFINRTNREVLSIAAHFADDMLRPGSKLLQEVGKKNDWKYGTEMSGTQVAARLCQVPLEPIQIVLYKSINPWSSARASWDGEVISINIRYLNQKTTTVEKLVGSIVHEFCHAAGFGHGSNRRNKDKELHSVPYAAGILAHKLMEEL